VSSGRTRRKKGFRGSELYIGKKGKPCPLTPQLLFHSISPSVHTVQPRTPLLSSREIYEILRPARVPENLEDITIS